VVKAITADSMLILLEVSDPLSLTKQRESAKTLRAVEEVKQMRTPDTPQRRDGSAHTRRPGTAGVWAGWRQPGGQHGDRRYAAVDPAPRRA
jgi:hypothetical protein